ncbi:hypothetical protein [Streptomyces sp. AVP053U2]|uniref:hypothetical protein n=1 Tax=Streptomyces sp. AVP053U2 TaxID=1737066 RepID=UPI00073BB817|nr:hypothetical protein [Streptomyces sp. AVP053U2]ODA69246.1 hypothetical protein APS67_006592 [Streptomyces sp. AVP053U2]
MSVCTSSREARLAQLLDTIRTWGGRWTSGRVQDLRRLTGQAPCRTTARRDLLALATRGHLDQRGPDNDRYFTLHTRKDRA